MEKQIYMAPLQGFTDFSYRKVFTKYFSGVDKFFSPYIQWDSKRGIDKKYLREVLPENNSGVALVPQILCVSAEDAQKCVEHLSQSGYGEININMGCPYPMVTRRGKGAGLLTNPSVVHSILDQLVSNFPTLDFSVKMRVGLENTETLEEIMGVLKGFPLKEVIVHPRLGKQLYKGTVSLDWFEEALHHYGKPLVYNGDITSAEEITDIEGRFPTVNGWMLGRGLLADPFLPMRIKGDFALSREEQYSILTSFHEDLVETYGERLSGQKHLLIRMKQFWEYFGAGFPEERKALKKIHKANSIDRYWEGVNQVLK